MGYKNSTAENKLMVYSSKQQYFFPNIYVPFSNIYVPLCLVILTPSFLIEFPVSITFMIPYCDTYSIGCMLQLPIIW